MNYTSYLPSLPSLPKPIYPQYEEQLGAVIFTSEGGAGHKIVAGLLFEKEKAKLEETFRKQGVPANEIEEKVKKHLSLKSVLHAFLGERIGQSCVDKWNNAQKEGDIIMQEKLVRQQPLADRFFFLPFFVRTLSHLLRRNPPPTKIINTQVMGLKAVLYATKVYNRYMSALHPQSWKPIKVELWMTDLPDEAEHFFKPLKSLPEDCKPLLVLHAPMPRLDELALKDQNEQEAIRIMAEKTSISPENIIVHKDLDLPVRSIYKSQDLKKFAPGKAVDLELDLKTQEQIDNLKKTPHLSKSLKTQLVESPKGNKLQATYHINAKDKVYSLMLGSQPSKHVVKNSIKNMIEVAKQDKTKKTVHFFVFCGKDEEGQESLFKDICKELSKQQFPENLKIIPLPFQDPNNIAKMRARSDIRFMRSGGASCFEEKALASVLGKNNGQVCIFSECDHTEAQLKVEAKRDGITIQDILVKAIPVWEGGNAKNLVKTIQAKIVSSATFKSEIGKDLGVKSSPQVEDEDLEASWEIIEEEKKLPSSLSEEEFEELGVSDLEINQMAFGDEEVEAIFGGMPITTMDVETLDEIIAQDLELSRILTENHTDEIAQSILNFNKFSELREKQGWIDSVKNYFT